MIRVFVQNIEHPENDFINTRTLVFNHGTHITIELNRINDSVIANELEKHIISVSKDDVGFSGNLWHHVVYSKPKLTWFIRLVSDKILTYKTK